LVDGDSVPVCTQRFTLLGKIEDDLVRRASELFDRSRLLDIIDGWENTDRSGPGGRPRSFPVRALLVAMMLCAVTDQPMLAIQFRDVLFRQISPTMRYALRVPKPPDPYDLRGWNNVYRNIRTRIHDLLALMDPSPVPKNRRFDPDVFEALFEERRSQRTEEEWAERLDRLTWFINQILDLSIRTLPREVRRQWKGSVAVDDTVIEAFARPSRRERRKKKGVQPKTLRYSSDSDADWHHRDKQEGPNRDPEPGELYWGFDAALVVSCSDDPHKDAAIPTLIMGTAPLRKPSTQVGQSAIVALNSVASRGYPAKYLAGDRAYSQAKPEHFQLPARALGYKPVLDYKIDQLGRQGSFAGMIQVDGGWYCPAMPEPLINATKDLRNKEIDEDIHRARIEERRNYEMRPRGRPDAEGHIRVVCPAAGPNPRARCVLKPKSEGGDGQVKTRIPVTDVLNLNRPKICTQQSVTLPAEEGAKFAQEIAHESPEWHSMYATQRNSNEGMNGFIKDGAHEAVDDPERRRIRGVAAQSVLVAFQLFAANIRKIDEFLAGERPGKRRSASSRPAAAPVLSRTGVRRPHPSWRQKLPPTTRTRH